MSYSKVPHKNDCYIYLYKKWSNRQAVLNSILDYVITGSVIFYMAQNIGTVLRGDFHSPMQFDPSNYNQGNSSKIKE